MTTPTPDRVSYSYGFKVPGKTQYSSTNVNISFSTDLRPNETPEQALERARGFVLVEADRELEVEQATAPRGAEDVRDQAFDIANKMHVNIATNIMDHLNIKADRHEAKMKFVLKGKRVGDIRDLLEADYAAFQAKQKRGRA